MRHLSRDSFARGQYHRETISNSNSQRVCMWCGLRPKNLFTYTWEEDTDRCPPRQMSRDLFCSFDCFRTYNT